MKIEKAKNMAKRLRDRHNLSDWKILFEARKSDIIATCYSIDKLFFFNIEWFSINSSVFCKDQILHEIAHALAGARHHHNEVWRSKCIEIGAIPKEVWENGYPEHSRVDLGRQTIDYILHL